MTADTTHFTAQPMQPSLRRLIVAATIGNIFEWFDFVVYGFFALTIAEVFFPAGNPTVSLLVTFGAFGLAYFVRPLGAIIVGGYTDRAGRKAGLLLSMALMLIGPAGLYVRAKVVETPEFLEAEKPETMPIKDVLHRHPMPVLLALGISIISNSSFYILAYIPTYGVKTLHLPASTGFTATLIGGAILAIGCPVAGYWSDKIARRPLLMVISCWLFVLTSYPAFYLMAAWPSLAACIIAVGWLQFVKAGYSGVLPSLLSEQFPVQTRAIGVSLGFSTAVSMFGGLAPLVATWLLATTGE